MNAENVLESAALILSLPTRALELPGVAKMIGASGYGFKPPPKNSSPVAKLTLHATGWEWEEESFEYHDGDGAKESREIRTQLTIDDARLNSLPAIHSRTCHALASLGGPFDSELFDATGGSNRAIKNARLDPACPMGRTQDASPQEKPDFDAILDLARQAGGISSLREWLEGHADDPRPLKADAEAFNAMVDANPSWGPFIEAGAQLIHWAASPAYRSWGGGELKEPKELPEWLSAEFEGETVLRRLGREGLPIGMPAMTQLLRMCAANPAIDERSAGDALCAYCESWSRITRPGSAGSFVSVVTASAIGEVLAARPGMGSRLSPAAKSFFDVPLEKMDGRITPQAYAMAEAHWLRAQSFLSAPKAPARKAATL